MFFANFLQAMPGAVSLGFLWGVMTLGVYLTYRILDFPDLTVDGSFALGGAVTATLLTLGWNPFAAMLVAFLAGALAGACTGFLHTKLKISGLLASILTQISLYSINLHVMMDKASMPLPSVIANKKKTFDTIFQRLPSFGLEEKYVILLYSAVIAVLVVVALWWFFNTEKGITVRSTGDNAQMSRALGVNTDGMKMLCLMLANGLVGLSGALIAQNNKNSSIDMGMGGIVFGLAAVIIGEEIFPWKSLAGKLAAVVLGSVVYRIIGSLVLQLNFSALDFKLISAIIITLALAMPVIRKAIEPVLVRKGWKKPKPAPQFEALEPTAAQARPQPEQTAHVPAAEGGDTSLTVASISKTFNAGTVNQKNALVDVELTLEPGDFVTVIGGNGAGKSTLLNIVAGVFPVDGGGIAIGSSTVTGDLEHKRARLIGRVFQDPMMGTAPGMTIEENLSIAMRRGQRRGLGPAIRKQERERFRELLKTLDLGLENRLRTRAGLLSGGQRQALTLLMATLTRPKLLLLDEHTAALDPKTARNVLHLTDRIVRENGLTALMVTHNMKDALQYGNRTIMMHEGKILIDIGSKAKKRLKVEDLLQMFERASGDAIANDRMLLS